MSTPKIPSTSVLQRDLARDLDTHFEDLVLAFQGRLYAFALGMTCSREDAEEAVQDTFVRAYRALKDYESDRIRALSIQAWLYRICLNVSRNRLRRFVVPTEVLNENGRAARTTSNPVAERYEETEIRNELRSLLDQLPERYRTAVGLRCLSELTYPEIAFALNQPEGTVKSNVHRGLAEARRLLTSADPGNMP